MGLNTDLMAEYDALKELSRREHSKQQPVE